MIRRVVVKYFVQDNLCTSSILIISECSTIHFSMVLLGGKVEQHSGQFDMTAEILIISGIIEIIKMAKRNIIAYRLPIINKS